MNVKRLLGFITGYMVTSLYFHSMKAYAMGVQLETAIERIGAVATGLVILGLLMVLFKKIFSASFFHGFLVATGLFLSFDIVVFHWFFQLHRITSGPEANWLEPLFVVFGTGLLIYGVKKEKSTEVF
jgi:uncharacterized membrane protein